MNNTIYFQITAGQGPAECCRAVALVLEKIMAQAKKLGMETEVIDREVGDMNRTLRSAVVLIQGGKCEEIADEWEGTVQWVAPSPYRIHHKRKNWFIGIKSFTPAELNDVDTRHIIYQTLRSSGPGGQHVNKTESAVRAIHVPTGLSVTASDQRSQMQNKKLATERLLIRLSAWNEEQITEEAQKNRGNHHSLQRGNPVKTIQEPLS